MSEPVRDPFDLTGETALITGAAGGLGRRFAEVLTANGARVALTDLDSGVVEERAAALRERGAEAIGLALDITDGERIPVALAEIADALGPVSILVNNAGTAGNASVLRVKPEDWRRMMEVNVDGAWFVAQEVARDMVRRGIAGSIVNIASILGLQVHQRVAPYAVSKAAVVQMTRAMALELARNGIRVNAIAPGSFDTGMTAGFLKSYYGQHMLHAIPAGRIGDESDLDGALLLLASRASSYMNGSIIPVDGGHALIIP